jgi:polyisoprenoid-binding protein YceI
MTTDTQQAVPTGTWNLDKVHSTVAFAVDYMSGTFQGSFSEFDAKVEDGTLRGSAEVSSIQVKDPNLEAHLQGPDFFDAERYPQLTFEAKDINRSGNDLEVTGELTMKGHSEPVEIRGTVTDPQDDPFGNVRFGIKLEAVVDRTKFGISWNNPLPSGEPALQDEVTLIADLQLVKEA